MKDNISIKYLEIINNSRIAYIESQKFASPAQAVTVLYLGGFCSDMEGTKATLLHEWAQFNRINFVRFDYRGHGQSSGEFVDFGIDDWVDDAIAIINHVIGGPVLLVGSSMGGWVGASLLKRCPQKIHSFIGIAAAPDFTEEFYHLKFSDAQRAIVDNGGVVELPSGHLEPYKIGKPLIEGGQKSAIFGEPLKFDGPIRLFQGMRDISVPYERAINLSLHIECDDLRLELVKNADHGFSRPEDMDRIYAGIIELLEYTR